MKSEQALKEIYKRHEDFLNKYLNMSFDVFMERMLLAKSNKEYIKFITDFMANNPQTQENEFYAVEQSLKFGLQEFHKLETIINDLEDDAEPVLLQEESNNE
jgi:hypothetical protein